MGHQHDRARGAAQRFDARREAIGRNRVESREGLVEQHQLRVVDERARDREALGEPARERAGDAIGDRFEPLLGEQRRDARAGVRDAVEPRREAQVLARRELRIQERRVADVADEMARAAAIGAARVRARCRRSGARARRGCRTSVVLPAPLGPSTVDHRARRDLEVDAGERR